MTKNESLYTCSNTDVSCDGAGIHYCTPCGGSYCGECINSHSCN